MLGVVLAAFGGTLVVGEVWGPLVGAWLNARRYRHAVERRPTVPPERVLLACPCKGAEPRLEANARRLLEQDHPDYAVVFVTESDTDAAVPILERLLVAYPHGRRLVSGRARTTTQKIHNILGAWTSADPATVLASVDADMTVPDVGWLRRLVRPLGWKDVAVTTAFFQVPVSDHDPVAHLCAAIVRSFEMWVAGLSGWVFGGTFALRRDTFENLGGPQVWDEALAEDIWLSVACAEARLRVLAVPDAWSTNEPIRRLPGLWVWATRQTQANKYMALFPVLTVLASLLGAASLLPLLLLGSLGDPRWLGPGLIGLFAALVAIGGHALWLCWPQTTAPRQRLSPGVLVVPALFPMAALAMLHAALSRRLLWAGIRYDLGPRSTVRRVVFPDAG